MRRAGSNTTSKDMRCRHEAGARYTNTCSTSSWSRYCCQTADLNWVRSCMSLQWTPPLSRTHPWVCSAPLGRPVVPLVYMISEPASEPQHALCCCHWLLVAAPVLPLLLAVPGGSGGWWSENAATSSAAIGSRGTPSAAVKSCSLAALPSGHMTCRQQ